MPARRLGGNLGAMSLPIPLPAFASANPEATVFFGTIAVVCLAAAFNFATKPRTPEEMALFSPRVAAFFRFMNAVFPDPEKALEAIWQAWNDTRARLPSKQPKAPADE